MFSSLETVPGEQSEQDEAPGPLIVFLSHVKHVIISGVLYVPLGQGPEKLSVKVVNLLLVFETQLLLSELSLFLPFLSTYRYDLLV